LAGLHTTANNSLASILAKITSDPATQTTLAAIATTLAGTLAVTATQVGEVQASPTANTVLDRLKTIGAKDFATQTTLAAVLAALSTNHTDEVQLHTDIATTLAGLIGTSNASLGSILAKITADPATQTTLAAVL